VLPRLGCLRTLVNIIYIVALMHEGERDRSDAVSRRPLIDQ
jgi:hypothetical protein